MAMRRGPSGRFGLLAAAAVVVFPLIVTGCSLMDSAAPAGLPPAGELAVTTATPRAAESKTVSVVGGGPPIELPSGLTLQLEDADETLDTATRAALDDAAILFAAMYQAIERGEPDDGLYQRYASGSVSAAIRDIVAVFVSNDWTATGTAIVYRREAQLTGGDEATVSWCADLRNVLPLEIASGHVLESAEGNHSYLRYEGTMERSPSGVWVMTSLESRRGDPACL